MFSGFQTHRDDFAIAFTEKEMQQRLGELADATIPDEDLRARYRLTDNRDWKLAEVRGRLRQLGVPQPISLAYRPFDQRWGEYGGMTMDFPRRELMDHVAGRGTLCLLAPRGVTGDVWRHAFVVDKPANDCVVSTESREANQVLPLWRFGDAGAEENFSPAFRIFLDDRYAHHFGAEEVFGYIYAVLHAQAYRTRYADFLRIDFPRIPFPERAKDFEALSRLGWALVEAHLLRPSLPRAGMAAYVGRRDDRVETVRYDPSDGTVWINGTQGFRPVPDDVWTFRIGGYQVLDKYLKSRKGRALSLDEIRHVARICDALAFTIEQMKKIDAAYLAAFPDS